MRSFSSFLLFEDVFDSIPDDGSVISSIAHSLFTPTVEISSADCNTALGTVKPLDYDLIGLRDLNGTVITQDDVTSFFNINPTPSYISTREYSCTLKSGICKKCYEATYPDAPVVNVNDLVTLRSKVLVFKQTYKPEEELILNLDIPFDSIAVTNNLGEVAGYYDDNLLQYFPNSVSASDVTIRTYVYSNKPFYVYLANTFSGSLLGIKPLPTAKLPVRKEVLDKVLTEGLINTAMDLLVTSTTGSVSPETIDYVSNIKDPFEKFLTIYALYVIFKN